MDFIKNAMGSSESNQQGQPTQSTEQKSGGGGFMGGLGDKFNSAAGGGKESEKNEDYLDKGKPPTPPDPPIQNHCPSPIHQRHTLTKAPRP